jgi:hypothetical protein
MQQLQNQRTRFFLLIRQPFHFPQRFPQANSGVLGSVSAPFSSQFGHISAAFRHNYSQVNAGVFSSPSDCTRTPQNPRGKEQDRPQQFQDSMNGNPEYAERKQQ